MKKLLLYMGCAVAMLSACDPNDEFIDTLDAEAKAAGIDIPKGETYTLTAADYDIVGKGKYDNFDSDEEAADSIPKVLAQVFSANSSDGKFELKVSYNVYIGNLQYLKDIIAFKNAEDIENYELTTEDYDSMGENSGEPGKYNNFDSNMDIPSYLKPLLLTRFPDAKEGDEIGVIYKFYSGGVQTRSDIYEFNGTEWLLAESPEAPSDVILYELTSGDYDDMGKPGESDSFSTVYKVEDYIFTFLMQNYPYAVNGDKVALVYKDGGDFTAQEYVFSENVWSAYQSTIVSTAPFKFDGTTWSVVPPIKFVKVDETDTAIIFRGAEGKGAIITEDYELVGNGFFKNFDVRTGKSEETEAVRIEKLSKIIKNKYDDLALDQIYFIQYKVYTGDENIESQDSDNDGLWDIYLKAVEDN